MYTVRAHLDRQENHGRPFYQESRDYQTNLDFRAGQVYQGDPVCRRNHAHQVLQGHRDDRLGQIRRAALARQDLHADQEVPAVRVNNTASCRCSSHAPDACHEAS